MPQGTTMHFVTFPDGKVDQASINIFGASIAKARCISEWFPEHIFGPCRWLDDGGYAVGKIWEGMVEKGFKVHSIDVPQKDQ